MEKEREKQELMMMRVFNACYSTTDQMMVNFGKHQGNSYPEMVKQYPQYCEWVITTMELEEEASQEEASPEKEESSG